MDMLRRLRRELDEAITYGAFRLARRLIRSALIEARDLESLGELAYFKGQACLLEEEYLDALTHFDRAISCNPHDGAAFNDKALCMVEFGMIGEALAYFDKGIEVEPDYATVYHNKGWLLNRIGRHAEALAYFKEALALEPDRAVTYENIGNAYANLGDLTEALKAYRTALSLLKPGYPSIRKQLLSEMKRIEKARGKRYYG